MLEGLFEVGVGDGIGDGVVCEDGLIGAHCDMKVGCRCERRCLSGVRDGMQGKTMI